MPIEIIAELAQGFEGNPEQACLLMKAAAAAGANAAKFQMVYADELATPDYEHYGLFKSLEMPTDVWQDLVHLALDLGIELHLDIFGIQSLRLSEQIGVKTIKLHGTDIANIGLLHEVAKSSIEKVLLGAGGAYLAEVDRALEILSSKQVIVLLGFQGYPTLTPDNQISRVTLLVNRFKSSGQTVTIGFADHAEQNSQLSYALAATAIGAGATIIEKHLTLGRVMKLEDHESALNPDEFFEFTQTIRGCYSAIGASSHVEDFGMSISEQEYRIKIRRHVVASRNMHAGNIISPSDVVLKRSPADMAVMDLSFAYNKVIKNGVQINQPILIDDIT
jgi:N,N'-diacetyllegionaminate synthase